MRDQLERHLMRLEQEKERSKTLLVLTPDDERPIVIAELGSESIAWANFASLDQAIDGMLADDTEVVSEREAFLLRELQSLLQREELIAPAQNVVVVAARSAWPEYQKHFAYVCQPRRTFQRVQRIAFYCDGEIKAHVPKVVEVFDSVTFDQDMIEPRLTQLVTAMLNDSESNKQQGADYKVFLLTSPDHPETLQLDNAIRNNLVSDSGRPSAYTQGQRYTSEVSLKLASTTSDLV